MPRIEREEQEERDSKENLEQEVPSEGHFLTRLMVHLLVFQTFHGCYSWCQDLWAQRKGRRLWNPADPRKTRTVGAVSSCGCSSMLGDVWDYPGVLEPSPASISSGNSWNNPFLGSS